MVSTIVGMVSLVNGGDSFALKMLASVLMMVQVVSTIVGVVLMMVRVEMQIVKCDQVQN